MKKIIMLLSVCILLGSCNFESLINNTMKKAIDYYFIKEGVSTTPSVFYVGAKLYSGKSSTGWKTLELLPYSKVQPIVAIIRYANDSTSDIIFSVRKYNTNTSIQTIQIVPEENNSIYSVSDPYGRIEYQTNVTANCNIYLDYFIR